MKRNLNVFKTICIQLLLFIARLKKNKQMFFGKLLYVYINEHRMQIQTSFRKFSHLTTDRNEKRKPF